MENQHQKITGYRDLSQKEIDLMNRIKAHGEATQGLTAEVNAHLAEQNSAAGGNDPENLRLANAEPFRWLAMAHTDLQVGIMKLVRAVAQPTSF